MILFLIPLIHCFLDNVSSRSLTRDKLPRSEPGLGIMARSRALLRRDASLRHPSHPILHVWLGIYKASRRLFFSLLYEKLNVSLVKFFCYIYLQIMNEMPIMRTFRRRTLSKMMTSSKVRLTLANENSSSRV